MLRSDEEIRNAMAEQGDEMTLQEVRDTKLSIVQKLNPALLEEGYTVDQALDIIIYNLTVQNEKP